MNNYNLKGRVAIVTGGAQGLGYAITKRLLESDAQVIVWDIDQKAMDETLKKLTSDPIIFVLKNYFLIINCFLWFVSILIFNNYIYV